MERFLRMKNSFVGRVVTELVEIYLKKHITRSAAELSYFLTLSFFPFFICLYWLMGLLNVDITTLLSFLQVVIPQKTMATLNDYLGYVSAGQSAGMLIAGLFLMATSSSAAFRAILNFMDDLYEREKFKGIWGVLLSFVFPLVFLFTIYMGIVVLLTGEWFLQLLDRLLGIGSLFGLWGWFRFLALFFFLTVMIYALYRFIAPRSKPRIPVVYGTLFTSLALVAVSILFSAFINLSTRYALVYGSLASIIILMVWLYLCSNIIILGGVLNYVLSRQSKPHIRAHLG